MYFFQNNTIGYLLILSALLSRMRSFNLHIKELRSIKIESEQIAKMRSAAILLDKTCDTLEFVKICYSINTLTSFVHLAFSSVLCSYSMVSYLLREDANDFDLIFMMISIGWQLYNTPILVSMFIFPALIENEGKKTENSLDELLLKAQRTYTKAHKILEIVNLQLHHRRPIIECGIFEVTWKLLFLGIVACTSYVVIILQFEFLSFTNVNPDQLTE